jgi:Protein of unknown function DUF262/Protein of unknown function (DUF1524)
MSKQHLHTDVVTVGDLFNTLGVGYKIPAYQRNFAWDSARIEEFLDTIEEVSEADSSDLPVGVMVLQRDGIATQQGPATIYHVIDGQQRLTIFTIIAAALFRQISEKVKGWAPPTDLEMFYSTKRASKSPQLPRLIREGDTWADKQDPNLSPLTQFLIAMINGQKGAPGGANNGFNDVFKQVNLWCKEFEPEKLKRIVEALCSKLIVIKVELQSEELAFTLFEAINSKNEPLTVLEVLKSKCQAKGIALNWTDDLLEKKERTEQVQFSDLLLFVTLNVLDSTRKVTKRFASLKRAADSALLDNSALFVKTMEETAKFLDNFNSQQAPHLSLDDNSLMAVLKEAKHTMPLYLLARFNLAKTENPGAFSDVLRACLAFYALRPRVLRTKGIPETYRDIYATLNLDYKTPNAVNPSAVRFMLRRQLEKDIQAASKSAIPQDFKSLWLGLEGPQYGRESVLCRLYLFIYLTKTFSLGSAPLIWLGFGKNDLDHVYPQHLNEIPDVIHSVGNLTLIPAEINKQLTNVAWKKNYDVLLELADPKAKSPFLTNTDFEAMHFPHLIEFKDYPVWEREQILQRQERILNLVWDTLISWL